MDKPIEQLNEKLMVMDVIKPTPTEVFKCVKCGRSWDSERLAKYCCVCPECGKEMRHYCEPCFGVKLIEKWKRLPRKKWDGKTPLGNRYGDMYFDIESMLYGAGDYLDMNLHPSNKTTITCNRAVEILELTICRKIDVRLDITETICDQLNWDFADSVHDKILELERRFKELLNAILGDVWEPGDVVPVFEEE